MSSFVKKGIRYRLFRAHGGRFGPGKIHITVYRGSGGLAFWGNYEALCARDKPLYYGDFIARDEDIEADHCKKCWSKGIL